MAYGSSAFGSETYGGSLNVIPSGIIIFTIDVKLLKLNAIKTFNIDARLVFFKSTSFNIDSIIIQRRSNTFTLDAALQKNVLKTFSINANLKENNIIKTFDIDSRLVLRKSFILSADAALSKNYSTTFSLSARCYKSLKFLSGFNYRKKITINGTSQGVLTNFEKKFTLHKENGTDNCQHIYLGSDIHDDFLDIRITNQDGFTLLSYYIENTVSGVSTDIWIKIPYIPASPGNTFFYIYFRGTQTSLSNARTTFFKWIDADDINSWVYDNSTYSKPTLSNPSGKKTRIVSNFFGAGNNTNYAFVYASLPPTLPTKFVFETKYNQVDNPLAPDTLYIWQGRGTMITKDRWAETTTPAYIDAQTQYGLGNLRQGTFLFGFDNLIRHFVNQDNIASGVNYEIEDPLNRSLITSSYGQSRLAGTLTRNDFLAVGDGAATGVCDATFDYFRYRTWGTPTPVCSIGVREARPGQTGNVRSHRVGLKIFNG